MILNPHSWHARWYRYSQRKEPPNDLCSYCWHWIKGVLLVGFLLLIVVFGGRQLYRDWPVPGYVLGAMTCFVLLCIAVEKVTNSETMRIICEFLKARKERYCPRITWQDEEKAD